MDINDQLEFYRQLEVGNIVDLYVSGSNFYPNVSKQTIKSIVIALRQNEGNPIIQPEFSTRGVVLFGFKEKEYTSYPIIQMKLLSKVDNYNDYKYMYMFDPRDVWVAKIHKFNSTNKASPGNWCKSCSTFFAQSSPNQSDQTFVCWSCRNFPFYK